MKLSKLKPNQNNPRLIKDDKFRKLVQSIKDFPKMMELRPIIVDEEFVIQGGNMRYKALQELGYKDVPDEWIKQANDLTEDEKKQFIIKDNVGFGDWDWNLLANEWDNDILLDWGLDVWKTNDTLIDVDDVVPVEDNKPKMTDDGYSLFELVMLHENKLVLLDTLNEIKRGLLFEKLEDALMELIRIYKK